MDVQEDLGRMRETKVTDTEVNWLYSALIARQPIDPTTRITTLDYNVLGGLSGILPRYPCKEG
jgi:hypothetical protein